MLKKKIITGILLLFVFTLSGCNTFSEAVQIAIEQTQTASVETEETPTETITISATQTSIPTPTTKPSPTLTCTPTEDPITKASEITKEMEGQTLEVCGEVTYYGEEICPACTFGYYAYLILDDNFYIISYEWSFSTAWIGSHIMVKDIVETMGSKPIFIYGGTEGWDGSECEKLPNGTLTCDVGDYFKFVDGCY